MHLRYILRKMKMVDGAAAAYSAGAASFQKAIGIVT